MEEVRSLAVKILDEARLEIQANMARQYRVTPKGVEDNGVRWVNASGRSSAAFQVVEEEGSVRLVYRGDDVAPLNSIQYGHDEVPSLEEAEQWREEKMKSGAGRLPRAASIVKGIEERGGTERKFEPQTWIIDPVIETAVQALNEQLPAVVARSVRFMLLGN